MLSDLISLAEYAIKEFICPFCDLNLFAYRDLTASLMRNSMIILFTYFAFFNLLKPLSSNKGIILIS